MVHLLRFGALVSLVLAASCGGDGGVAAPAYAEHVAPLILRSCAPCHRPGEPAPFSLLTFADVHKKREQIVEVTGARLMPPWLPTHGDFVGDRRLQPAEIELLRRWVENGAPRGDEAAEPKPPVFASGWQLREPDLVVTAPQPLVVEAGGGDVFRNLVIPLDLDGVKFVSAVEIRPGNRAVHHAVLAVDPTFESRRLEALDETPGYPGMAMGGALPPDGHFLGWTPGKRTRPSPPGQAFRLWPGHDLVLQVHVQPTGKREVVQPQIGLYFTNEAPTVQMFPLALFNADIDIPAGEASYRVRDELTLPVATSVHAVYPHAHYLGRSMRALAILPNGSERVLLAIDRWDFDWQDDYRCVAPIALPAGARLVMDYVYDNSEANAANPNRPPVRVRFGQRSLDEMATLTFSVTVGDLEQRQWLQRALLRHDLDKEPEAGNLWLQLAGLERERGDHDAALVAIARAERFHPDRATVHAEWGRCLEAAGRVEDAVRHYREALDIDNTNGMANAQLGAILARAGDSKTAREHFKIALLSMPNVAVLHHNYATASFSEGDLADAELHYSRALQIDPQYFSAWLLLGRVLLERGDKDRAREALQQAAALAPDDPAVARLRRQLDR
ncbi:MAG: tetratricopeptide repeat protein [Planctomycetes bacterium]|nr:tetratricopeptide repeat protein [Planctomycetota bacterium]MCB9884278.1 tetratricopeptide repeat protein [Planctomycetota bacterium]